MIEFQQYKDANFGLKLIFLDMDGVLTDNPHGITKEVFKNDGRYIRLTDKDSSHGELIAGAVRKDLIENLKLILKETKTKIVISTNWRQLPNKDWWKNIEKILNTKIFGSTPVWCSIESLGAEEYKERFNKDTYHNNKVYLRSFEIGKYLEKVKCQNFIILDDMPLHIFSKDFPFLKDHFVCTNNNGKYGLTFLKTKEAIRVLNGGKPYSGSIPKISFPEEEMTGSFKKQKEIITTRVSNEYDKYHTSDILETPWKELYIVMERQEFNDIKQHPYFGELTDKQISLLMQYDKIALLKLRKFKV